MTTFNHTPGTYAPTALHNNPTTLDTEMTTIDTVLDEHKTSLTNVEARAASLESRATVLETSYDAEKVIHTDAGSYFAVADRNSEHIAQILAAFVGYKTGGSLKSAKFVGFDYDPTTPANVSIIVPANTATTAIMIIYGSRMVVSNGTGYATAALPLRLKSPTLETDLSSAANEDFKFEELAGCNTSTEINLNLPMVSVINTSTLPNALFTEAIDFTKQYTISLGTNFISAGTTFINTNFYMVVIAF